MIDSMTQKSFISISPRLKGISIIILIVATMTLAAKNWDPSNPESPYHFTLIPIIITWQIGTSLSARYFIETWSTTHPLKRYRDSKSCKWLLIAITAGIMGGMAVSTFMITIGQNTEHPGAVMIWGPITGLAICLIAALPIGITAELEGSG